jgi:SNF2 family DNA or RNA helicase
MISFINPPPDFLIPRPLSVAVKPLLTPQQLHEYQKQGVLHQLQHDWSMLWLGMGLGKTIITLTTMVDRMRAGQVRKTLIFGPLRVIQGVWAREARKWTHTQQLRFSVMHGSPEKRLRAMFADADVFLCNYENMNWLAKQLDHYYLSQGKPLPFDMVVYDEISKLKNSTTARVAGGTRDRKDGRGVVHKIKLTGWRKLIPLFKYRTGLTGTPASNGYLDLHGQYLAIDGGERLGEFVTHYKDSYFTSDYNGWKYAPTEEGKRWIEHHISDITLKMDSKDYLDMPAVNVSEMMVDLPPDARKHYQEIEKQLFTRLSTGTEIELFSKTSISNKCLQICNGSPYVNDLNHIDGFEAVHEAKLDALESVLEEAGGRPVLCSYSFVSDAERIMKRFKKYAPVNMTQTASARTEKVINDWNAGKIKLMIGHPASMGHGIDGLQESGNIVVWFGMPWSLELYDQMNARIDRQGQKSTVSIIRILCRDTVDLAVADAIARKNDTQEGLKSALQRYRDGITTNELTLNFL